MGYRDRLEYRGRRNNYFEFRKRIFLSDASRYGNRIVSIIKSCPFYIGSAEGVNQLKISDKTVSREHAVILEAFYENGGEGYILRDLDSTNGTWIDGRKIKKGSQERLQEGATVRFAQKEYRFLLEHTTIQ